MRARHRWGRRPRQRRESVLVVERGRPFRLSSSSLVCRAKSGFDRYHGLPFGTVSMHRARRAQSAHIHLQLDGPAAGRLYWCIRILFARDAPSERRRRGPETPSALPLAPREKCTSEGIMCVSIQIHRVVLTRMQLYYCFNKSCTISMTPENVPRSAS